MKKSIFVAFVLFFSCSKDSSKEPDPVCDELVTATLLQVTSTRASFNIYYDDTEDTPSWELEYGLSGFSLGTGNVLSNGHFIDGLASSTTYDAYVRTRCDNIYSNYSNVITFTTDTACHTPSYLELFNVTSTSVEMIWDTSDASAWEIEYGLVGFQLGQGTVVSTSEGFLTIEGLSPSTTYEFYVRANCGSQGYSDYEGPLVVTTNP